MQLPVVLKDFCIQEGFYSLVSLFDILGFCCVNETVFVPSLCVFHRSLCRIGVSFLLNEGIHQWSHLSLENI